MTRLLHDHAGTGLCAVAPTGRVLGMSGLFLRALGLAAPPPDAMLHDLLPLSEGCPPCAGWHWLLDLPPAPGQASQSPRPAAVRGGVLVRTLHPAETRAILQCPDLRDHAADTSARPASPGRTGVLLQLHAPDLRDLWDLAELADHPGPAGHADISPPGSSPSVPDAHLRQALDALSVGLAHDFGNVVASILGFAEIAVSRLHAAPAAPPATDPMVVRSLDNIVLGCQRAREVIAFAQSVAGRVDLNAEPADLHGLVTAWCAELAGELPPDAWWSVSRGQSTPEPPQPERLPPVRVDAARLREVFAEIWRNAAWAVQDMGQDMDQDMSKAQTRDTCSPDGAGHAIPTVSATPQAPPAPQDDNPSGRILVETTLITTSPRHPGRWVRLRVRDTGRGMDADTLCRMRDPYFSTKARHEGKGRGLARAAGIVRAHGGRLDIAAGSGLGCMVDILLPVAHGD